MLSIIYCWFWFEASVFWQASPTPLVGEIPKQLDVEAEQILMKGATVIVELCQDQVISGYFARHKKTPGTGGPLSVLNMTTNALDTIILECKTVGSTRLLFHLLGPNRCIFCHPSV